MTLGDVVVVGRQYPEDIFRDQLQMEAPKAVGFFGARYQDNIVVVPFVAHAPDGDRTFGDVDPAVPDGPVGHCVLGYVFALVLDREVAGSRCGWKDKRRANGVD